MNDFERAMEEVVPAFGISDESLAQALRNGIIDYGERWQHLLKSGKLFVDQVSGSEKTPIMAVLLEGRHATGKTALAAHLAKESGFPFVKMVSAEALVGYAEQRKCDRITKAFEDAHKSDKSVIILDDIERLLDYVPIGPRFSNIALQTLLVMCRKPPPNGRRMLIIGTTSNASILEQMGLSEVFQSTQKVPMLSREEVVTVLVQSGSVGESEAEKCATVLPQDGIGIRTITMLLEMAKQLAEKRKQPVDAEIVSRCASAIGL